MEKSLVEQMLEPHALHFVEIAKERARQIELWGDDTMKQPYFMVTVLAEEVGELAKAVLQHNPLDVRTEAIQVAATALAIIESTKIWGRELKDEQS